MNVKVSRFILTHRYNKAGNPLMKNRKWLVLALLVIAIMPLATYTGVTEGALIEPGPGFIANADIKPVSEVAPAEALPSIDALMQASEPLPVVKPDAVMIMTVENEPSALVPSAIVRKETGQDTSSVAAIIGVADSDVTVEPAIVLIVPVEPEPPAPVPSIIVANEALRELLLAETKQDVSLALSTIEVETTITIEAKTSVEMAAVSLDRQVEQAADIAVKPGVRVLREDVRDIANARVAIAGKSGTGFETAVLNFHGIRLDAAVSMTDRNDITIYDALYKLGAPIAEYWLSTWAPPLENQVLFE